VTAFAVSEAFRLRRFAGALFVLLALVCVAMGWVGLRLSTLNWGVVMILAAGPVFLATGIAAFAPGRSPQPRLKFDDTTLWILPDTSSWSLISRPHGPAQTIPLDDLEGVEDGGWLYSYRRVSLRTSRGTTHLHTTHLDTGLRTIVDGINDALAASGRTLVEDRRPLSKRSGRWRVQTLA